MSELGNVFDAVEAPDGAPRGPDLQVAVEVPRSALGRDEGYDVDVPPRLPHEGAEVERHRRPDEPAGTLRLHLSAGLPDRTRLRLRGQGGVSPGGVPGDLFVQVDVVDDPPSWAARYWWAVALSLVAAGVAAWALR